MKNQFYPSLVKGFLVSAIIWYMPVKTTAQMPPPEAVIINNSGTTQISCVMPSISVTATGGVSYEWSNGLGTNANAIITAAGTYTVTAKAADSSSTQASIVITDSPNGPPSPASIDGPVNVCNYVGTNDRIIYTAVSVAGVSNYDWTVPSTVNILSGQGTNVLTVTLSAGLTAAANKQLRVRATAPCGVSSYTIKYLTAQIPGSITTITGPADMCPFLGNGQEATYSITPVAGAVSYQWNVSQGAMITQNNGTDIRVQFDNNYITGTISVFAMNGCGMGNTRNLTVKRTTVSAPGTISGITNSCMLMPSAAYPAGMASTYSVSRMSGMTYNWAVPPGVIINSHSHNTTMDFINVSFTSSYVEGDISVVATNGCGLSPARIFKLSSYNPGAPSPIIKTFIQTCPEPMYQYSLSGMPTNAVSAQWAVPADGTIVSGQGTAAIVVSYPGFTTGTVSVFSNNGCGNSAVRSLNVVIPQCNPEFGSGLPDINSENKVGLIAGYGNLNVNVFPNPTSTDFTLQVLTAENEKAQARIMDVHGTAFKTVDLMPFQKFKLGAEFRKGIYFVEIKQGNKKSITKLIKY